MIEDILFILISYFPEETFEKIVDGLLAGVKEYYKVNTLQSAGRNSNELGDNGR